jgi:hypothetical protein
VGAKILDDFDQAEKAARIVSKQLLGLDDIVLETIETGNTALGCEQLARWKSMTVQLITETVSESEAVVLRDKRLGSFLLGQPLRNFLSEAELYKAFLVSLYEAIQKQRTIKGGVLSDEVRIAAGSSLMATDLFISYSSKDAKFVGKLANDLVSRGLKVWWDKWMMKVGDSLHKKIQEAITSSAWLGVVLSPNSVSSPWVEKELNSALMKELEQKEVFVLPILYEDCPIPLMLKDKVYADFRSSYQRGLSALLERFTLNMNPTLLEGLMSGSSSRMSSCYAKMRPEDKKLYVDELVKKLSSASASEKTNALTGLFVIRDPALSGHLLAMTNDSADTVRRMAIFYLGELRDKSVIRTISARLSDKSQEVRAAARVAYRKITGTNG